MDYRTQRLNCQKKLDNAEMSLAGARGRQGRTMSGPDNLETNAVTYWEKEVARLQKRLAKLDAEQAAFRARVDAALGRCEVAR